MDKLVTDTNARLNSIEQVMARLNVGRSTVYGLVASGELRSCKIGQRRLVSESALVEYIERLEGPRGDAA